MATWTAKDPDAVLDYLYTIPLDQGDSVASYTFEVLSGTVTVSDEDRTGANVTVWLTGGEAGETAVFRVSWTTADGRTNDDVITLPVVESDLVPLVLTGYAKPAPAHLILRYPAFAAVPASTIAFWLTDAERFVTDAWSEADYAVGLMALAAHNMALSGVGADAAALTGVAAGVTAMKSGSLSVNFTPEAANARMTGDFAGTRYGQEYLALLRSNRGGPLVGPTGVPDDYLCGPAPYRVGAPW